MDRVDGLSFLFGAVAMALVGGLAMATGYNGMSFSAPALMLVGAGMFVEMLLMRWLGPVVPMLLCMPLYALAERRPRLGAFLEAAFPYLLFATSLALAVVLLRFMPGPMLRRG